MNWKIKTLKVRLSSYSDWVLCISEIFKVKQNMCRSFFHFTPVCQFNCQFFIDPSHYHDEHQIQLNQKDWFCEFFLCPYHCTSCASKKRCIFSCMGVIEEPDCSNSSVDNYSKNENDDKDNLKPYLDILFKINSIFGWPWQVWDQHQQQSSLVSLEMERLALLFQW